MNYVNFHCLKLKNLKVRGQKNIIAGSPLVTLIFKPCHPNAIQYLLKSFPNDKF